MDPVEIRPNKILVKGFAIAVAVIILAVDVYLFTSKSYDGRLILKLVQAGCGIGGLIAAFRIFKKASHKEPFMTLNRYGLTINNGRETLEWSDVQYAMLEETDDHTNIILYGYFGERRVGVSWLDKSPQTIIDLIEAFKAFYH